MAAFAGRSEPDRRRFLCDGHHEMSDLGAISEPLHGYDRAVTLSVAAPALDDRAG
jgi:hypothetical protein